MSTALESSHGTHTPISPYYLQAAFTLSHSFHIFNPCPHYGRCIACTSSPPHTTTPLHQPLSLPLHLKSTPVPRLLHAPHCPGAHPLHTKQYASDQGKRASETNGNHPLLSLVCSLLPCSSHSLSLSSLSSPSLSHSSCFTLSLVLFTEVRTGIVPRS